MAYYHNHFEIQKQTKEPCSHMGKLVTLLLGLITASLQYGQATVMVKIRAYNATGEVNIVPNNQIGGIAFTLGMRVLLTCDVTGLPEDSEVLSYKWYHKCAFNSCEIQDGDPYYRVVDDTLLVDVTSEKNVGRYHCIVTYRKMQGESVTAKTFTTDIALAGTTTAFLYTPTSLLSEHAVITDGQQITGRNGQQWIKCTNGNDNGKAAIQGNVQMDPTYISVGQTATLTIRTTTLPQNGHYYCLADTREYNFNLFLRKQGNDSIHGVTLVTPTVSGLDTSMWTLTSSDGSQVERYIVEFECRVRSITFVEKSMSVRARGGTGRVATSVSCFGGLGQLYRVKVWAVSGPNISPALVCIPDGHIKEEVNGPTPATQVLTSTATTLGSTGSTGMVLTSTRSGTPISTASGTLRSSPGPDDHKPEDFPTNDNTGPFIGAGVGVGLCLLLMALAMVAITLVVVLVKRRAANKPTGSIKMRANPCYKNPVVVELEEKDGGAEYDCTVKNKENGSINDGFDPYEDIDSKAHEKHAKAPPPKASSTPASATNVGELYAVVDKSKKKGMKKKGEENGCIETNKDDLYTVPVKKKDKLADKGMGVSSGTEKSEDNDDVAELKYEPKADSESAQQSEGDEKSLNADMLYAVVDKSRKKKK